jgi:PPOX class probable F420-dependent enzyme
MSDAEMAEFLAGQRVVVVATNGAGGWPHLMPLWYVIRDGEIWAWTYAKSQKVKNLERDPRATLQIESGEQYHELRGVMVEANTVVHRELDAVSQLGSEIFARYSGGEAGPDALDVVRAWPAGITASWPGCTNAGSA